MSDMFGLDNIFEDREEKSAALAIVIGFLIRVVLGITTAGFFYVYAGNLFSWLAGPAYSPWISAVAGTFCIDFLAWAWSNLRENHASTETQISVGKMGTIANMSLSVVVTVIFFILLTDFVSTTNADGTLNNVGLAVNIGGLLVGTLAIAGNGALWAYYQANGIASRRALNTAVLMAAQIKGQFEVDKQNSRLTIERTISDIARQLPALTAHAGTSNASRYLQERFGEIDKDGNGSLTPEEVRQWAEKHPEEARRLNGVINHVNGRAENGNFS